MARRSNYQPRRARNRPVTGKYDVPGCKVHEALDQNNERIRIGACTGYCRIAKKLEGRLPLTQFLLTLMDYKSEDLAKASAAKAAKVYGIKEQHAAGYIRLEKQIRGMVS